jgi:aminomethyltransferase
MMKLCRLRLSAAVASAAEHHQRPTKTEHKLKATKLHGLHLDHRAKMAPYAGWSMPLQYEGMAAEHLHTREYCSLFDVSHMGQVRFYGADREKFIEKVTVADMSALPQGGGRLTVMLTDAAGVIDDTIVHKHYDHVSAVLNASRFGADIAHLTEMLSEFGGDVYMEIDASRSLMALQGPLSSVALRQLIPGIENLPYMAQTNVRIDNIDITISRSGYTGEDGFELSVKHQDAEPLAKKLLDLKNVKEGGLGARNSLRVEAGFCLYGKELDEHISINEARLMWLVSKRRREEGGFIGHGPLMEEASNPQLKPMRRVGITSSGICARDGSKVLIDGNAVGYVTSGCPSPSLKCNVAQGFVHVDHMAVGTRVELVAREGRPPVVGEIAKLPFVPLRRSPRNPTA